MNGSDIFTLKKIGWWLVSHNMISLSHKPKWLYHLRYVSHRFLNKWKIKSFYKTERNLPYFLDRNMSDTNRLFNLFIITSKSVLESSNFEILAIILFFWMENPKKLAPSRWSLKKFTWETCKLEPPYLKSDVSTDHHDNNLN